VLIVSFCPALVEPRRTAGDDRTTPIKKATMSAGIALKTSERSWGGGQGQGKPVHQQNYCNNKQVQFDN